MHLLFLGAATARATFAACTRSCLDLGDDLILRHGTDEPGDRLAWWGQENGHCLSVCVDQPSGPARTTASALVVGVHRNDLSGLGKSGIGLETPGPPCNATWLNCVFSF